MVLILDDIISPFESTIDFPLLHAIQRVREGRTLIVFSQKLDLIRNADKIYVLNDGEIIEQGTDETLMKQNGLYFDMYMTQKLLESNLREETASEEQKQRRSVRMSLDQSMSSTYSRMSFQEEKMRKVRKSSIVYGKFMQNLEDMKLNQLNEEDKDRLPSIAVPEQSPKVATKTPKEEARGEKKSNKASKSKVVKSSDTKIVNAPVSKAVKPSDTKIVNASVSKAVKSSKGIEPKDESKKKPPSKK